jgi:hypothetical protein
MLPPWQDLVLAAGTAVGLVSKAYALADPRTTWSRWASLPNAVLYVGSVVAFASLGLWLTAALATCSMLLWLGIGIFRAPTDTHD